MALVIIINLVVLAVLCRIALTSGLEKALPFAAFAMIFIPIESSIPLGLFELTTQRLIIVVLLIFYFTSGRAEANRRFMLPMPLKILIIIHICWCTLSTMNSVVPLMSIKKAVAVIFEYYSLYFVFWRTISSTETIRKIILGIVLALIVCSVFGAFEAYGAENVLAFLPKAGHHFDMNAEKDREVRVQSTFDHPILFGAALAPAIALSFYLLSVAQTRRQRILLWLGIMLMFLNIYKTSSRGPWLDVIISCILLGFFARGKIRKYILVIGMLAITACVVRPGIWATVRGIYENSFDMNTSTGTSYEYRYALQHAVVHKLTDSPGRALWGYGLESFYDLKLQGDFLGQPHIFLSCDSSWSELMIETGFVGLFIIVLILFKPAWCAFRDYRRLPSPECDLSLVLFVNLIVCYFQMYSVGMYSWGQNGYMLWILIALVFTYPRCLEESADYLFPENIDVSELETA